jgi:hypothetical protein
LQRTVKSRGPDASEVGVKSHRRCEKPNRADAPSSGRRRRQESPILRGEREVRRKAIAQGMSDRLRCPVCSCAHFLRAYCTRDRGCSAHPAFPAPSDFKARNFLANLGRVAPRERNSMSGLTIIASSNTAVIARHSRRRTASLPLAYDRATQYSRGGSDNAEKPRRTGSPGQAGRRQSCCGGNGVGRRQRPNRAPAVNISLFPSLAVERPRVLTR